MPVNLEELALKSIEQYAAFSVRLSSIETTLKDMSSKSETKEEKFIAACNQLSRLEERIININNAEQRVEKRVSILEDDLDKLTRAVEKLAALMEDHNEDHCEKCKNESKITDIDTKVNTSAGKVDNFDNKLALEIEKLDIKVHADIKVVEDKVDKSLNGDKNLVEVRKLSTSPTGLFFVRALSSRWGIAWVLTVTAAVLIVFFSHYSIIKYVWDKFTLHG